MPTARSGLAASAVNGKIYAIGGWVGYSTVLSTVEEYDPYPLVVDFNGDGIVNCADMCLMIDHWNTAEPLYDIGPRPFGDGIVDVQDLIVLVEHLLEEYLVVEDFEDYNDYPPHEIWATWIDGYDVPTNGSTVGYAQPDVTQGEHYVETKIVHSGQQSMPFLYDNAAGAVYSEAERTFAVPQNWTKHGVKTLSLWFYGATNNTAAQMYVKVNGSKVMYDGDTEHLMLEAWQVWNIDLASFGVNLQDITRLAIGIEGNGATGTLLFDDIRLSG